MSIKPKYKYSREDILAHRTFPILNVLLLAALIIFQIFCIYAMVYVEPTYRDVINEYTVYVTPRGDGSLDINYRFKWTALDEDEPLTWVDIGMANPNFAIYPDYSSTIRSIQNTSDDEGNSYATVHFTRPYVGGETFYFNFTINQKNMLCKSGDNLFYEFIPGWFNSIPVQHYSFKWKDSENISSSNAATYSDDWLTWTGSMEAGEYRILKVNYKKFDAPTNFYQRFDDSGVYNEIENSKNTMFGFFMFIALLVEIFIIDCFVSYSRGRGFLRGYGYHIHTYGSRNPHYTAARNRHVASSRGGRSGGGCACACACACAGGGRAGCSQKDTYKSQIKK